MSTTEKKISVKVRKTGYPTERIVEFSAGGVGGLISIRSVGSRGRALFGEGVRVVIEPYRIDQGVVVHRPPADPLTERAGLMHRALMAIVMNPTVAGYLHRTDPKLLKQAREAAGMDESSSGEGG